jgi:hypothetical protein
MPSSLALSPTFIARRQRQHPVCLDEFDVALVQVPRIAIPPFARASLRRRLPRSITSRRSRRLRSGSKHSSGGSAGRAVRGGGSTQALGGRRGTLGPTCSPVPAASSPAPASRCLRRPRRCRVRRPGDDRVSDCCITFEAVRSSERCHFCLARVMIPICVEASVERPSNPSNRAGSPTWPVSQRQRPCSAKPFAKPTMAPNPQQSMNSSSRRSTNMSDAQEFSSASSETSRRVATSNSPTRRTTCEPPGPSSEWRATSCGQTSADAVTALAPDTRHRQQRAHRWVWSPPAVSRTARLQESTSDNPGRDDTRLVGHHDGALAYAIQDLAEHQELPRNSHTVPSG